MDDLALICSLGEHMGLLEGDGDTTELTLSQDNNETPEAAEHSKGMWDNLVKAVKEIAERK